MICRLGGVRGTTWSNIFMNGRTNYKVIGSIKYKYLEWILEVCRLDIF